MLTILFLFRDLVFAVLFFFGKLVFTVLQFLFFFFFAHVITSDLSVVGFIAQGCG